MKPTLLDRLIGQVAPTWAVRRLHARAALNYAMELAAFGAAGKGRGNADWRSNVNSADANLLGEQSTLNSRARQLYRDSWIIKSSIRAAKRNIVGTGIIPVPAAKDLTGKPLDQVNDAAERDFWRWAKDFKTCDTERRRTWWMQQRLCIAERKLVGEHFRVWSYQPNTLADGSIDKNASVGLRFTTYEPEQLDTRIAWYYDNGNEVRNGIELDADGAPVAYHFFTRNPNDFLPRARYLPIRIPAYRVFHYFDPERCQQSHGASDYHAVMQRVRDYHRRDDAEMWAAIMEACVGLVITKPFPTGAGNVPLIPNAAGKSGHTSSGMRTQDFVPGMVIETQPGEEVKPFTPSRPGGTYTPYAMMNLRGIAAGSGQSYEQLTRDFSQGTYSSQRQTMLEDRKETEIEQDDFIDLVVSPEYELWYTLWVLEGRAPITPEEFSTDKPRFLDCEYVTPALPWIDPQKEVNAYEKGLQLRIITRKEIVASRGGRLGRVLKQIAAEREMAEADGITFPEDLPPPAPPQQPQPGSTSVKPDDAAGDNADDGDPPAGDNSDDAAGGGTGN
jgi:lambda family phage portal protein